MTFPTGKVQALLASLALPPGRAHARDKLAALLWGGLGEAEARASLRQALFMVRKALPALPILVTEGDNVALDPATVEVDVVRFERRVAEGTALAFEEAAKLYQGDLLAGLAVSEPAFEEWLLTERERLRELAMEALAKLLVYQRRAGIPEAAVQTGRRLLALDPLQESVHRTLMRLYVQLGHRAAALRQYQECVAALQRELDVEPERETKRFYEEILRKGPALRGAETVVLTSPTPMVGRETEKGRLSRLLDEALAGCGRLAIVRGDAGIGKTRLVADLAALAVSRGARVLVGRSYQSEQILPFGPWVDAFRAGGITNTTVLEGLDHAWRGELARLLPELGAAPAPAPPDHRHLFEAVTRLVGHLAAAHALVLMLEDVHWADDMSVRLLAFIGRRIRSWPVLVLATVREEELIDAPTLRSALENLDREDVALGPLSEQETVTLVTTLARPGLGTGAIRRLGERLWQTSEGNPFMVVETMCALGQDATADAASVLPGRVRDVIVRRLDRLSNRSRRLVALASVIGRRFDFDLLQQAAGLGDREAAGVVEELVRRRVFHGVGEHLDFTHDLIRAVAYEQLAAPQRKLLHRVVAITLERACGEDTRAHDLALGTHYQHAEIWDKAFTHLSRAGTQAWFRWALEEALTCQEQALAALEKLPRSDENMARGIDLRLEIQQCLVYIADCARGLPHLRDAEALASRLGDRRRQALVASSLCSAHKELWNYADAIQEGERALAFTPDISDLRIEVQSHLQLGQAHMSLGNYRPAQQHLARSVTVLEEDRATGGARSLAAGMSQLGRLLLLVNSRHWLTLCLASLGDFAEGLVQAAAALGEVEGTEQSYPIMRAHLAAGDLYLLRGDGDRAVPHLETALAEWRRANTQSFVGTAARLAYAYALAGRAREAQERLDSFLDENPLPWPPVTLLRWGATPAAEAALLLGRTDLVTNLVRYALEGARIYDERGQEAIALRLQAALSASQTPPEVDVAESSYREALTLAEPRGMLPLVAHCHLGLGTLYARTSKPHGAREHLTSAMSMYGEMAMAFWRDQVETALARLP